MGIAIANGKWDSDLDAGRTNIPEEFNLYFEMWKKGEISIRKAAKILEISPANFLSQM